MLKPHESDSPDYAAIRARLFMPEMICCSAYDESMIKKRILAVGMSEILSKPPEISQFKQIMKDVEKKIQPKLALYNAYH